MENIDTPAGTIAPVKKELRLSLSVEAAFRLFTEGMPIWWPLKSHSVGEERTETCVFEGRLGGRIYEIMVDGKEVDWGRVLAWDPPHTLSFTWFPGREEDPDQVVEISFTDAGDETQISLLHRGWERFGDRAEEMRRDYDTGWGYVLGKYCERGAIG